MDQDQYVQALLPIVHKDMVGKKAEEPVKEQVAVLFLSLQMALAYALMTRVDLCIYVFALHRRTQAPLAGEVRRLNAIVRWAQKHPLCFTYLPMKCASHLEAHSDWLPEGRKRMAWMFGAQCGAPTS